MDGASAERLVRLETSHRIKNQLSLVNSMLELSAADTKDADAARQLQRAADRVRAIATVHRLVMDQDDDGVLPIDTVLADLCDALDRIYPAAVSFEADAAEVALPVDTVVRLTMIVGELVGAPYASGTASDDPDRRNGLDLGSGDAVRVTTRAEDAALTIEVAHRGDASLSAALGRVGGLIVDGFARQIGAVRHGADEEGPCTDRLTLQLS